MSLFNRTLSFAAAGVLTTLLTAPAVTQSATIAHWRFEGASTITDGAPNDWRDDYAGNHHLTGQYSTVPGQYALPASGNGSGFHNPIPNTQAENKYAAQFSGNGSLYAPDSDEFTQQQFTLEAYFNLTADVTGAFAVIAGNWSSNGDNRGYMISIDADEQVELHISSDGSSGNNERIKTGLTVSLNTDYYVAFAVDVTDLSSSGITFYYQQLSGPGAGELSEGIGLTHTKSAVANKNSPFTIGAQGNTTAHYFTGLIDEVRLSSGVLQRHELLAAVPEPASLGVFSAAGLGLLARRRRH